MKLEFHLRGKNRRLEKSSKVRNWLKQCAETVRETMDADAKAKGFGSAEEMHMNECGKSVLRAMGDPV